MFQKFKEFAFKGNVLDMAVGVVMGSAFGKIVSSLVSDVIMPVVGFLTAGIKFEDLSFKLVPAISGAAPVEIKYGSFIQSVVDFFIVAVSIFLFVSIVSKAREKRFEFLKKKTDEKKEAEEKKPTVEELLSDIKGLLEKETADKD